MKTGIIDVGGGLRDIYGLGILDHCMDADIHFDVCIGISAGSANLSAFLAGQRHRNYPFYTDYPFRKEYMSFWNFLKKGEFLNLEYVYGTLSRSDGENPLDYPTLASDPAEFIVVATNAVTGEPVYFTKADMAQDRYGILKSSSAIPFICKPQESSGVLCYDGALSDPVPVEKALAEGCEKVVVILTKPKDIPRTPGNDPKLATMIKRRYPKAAKALKDRHLTYNAQVARAKELEAEGKVLILAPDSIEGLSTLSRDLDALERMYQKGYRDAEAVRTFLGESAKNTGH